MNTTRFMSLFLMGMATFANIENIVAADKTAAASGMSGAAGSASDGGLMSNASAPKLSDMVDIITGKGAEEICKQLGFKPDASLLEVSGEKLSVLEFLNYALLVSGQNGSKKFDPAVLQQVIALLMQAYMVNGVVFKDPAKLAKFKEELAKLGFSPEDIEFATNPTEVEQRFAQLTKLMMLTRNVLAKLQKSVSEKSLKLQYEEVKKNFVSETAFKTFCIVFDGHAEDPSGAIAAMESKARSAATQITKDQSSLSKLVSQSAHRSSSNGGLLGAKMSATEIADALGLNVADIKFTKNTKQGCVLVIKSAANNNFVVLYLEENGKTELPTFEASTEMLAAEVLGKVFRTLFTLSEAKIFNPANGQPVTNDGAVPVPPAPAAA